MIQKEQHKKLGDTLWGIANDLRGAMNADDFQLQQHKKGLMQGLFPKIITN